MRLSDTASRPPAAARRPGLILKASIFATGCAGIVAEFVLSTLATYLKGNGVFQWTVVMSLMLFAMGLGSRLSRHIRKNLLDNFIIIEFILSALSASSAALAYGLAAFTVNVNLFVYALSLLIGGLIGFEIPLVTRLNESHEALRTNIAGVMEKDYYGSLLGGLFFAFFALPHLGLTYTPIVLGAINFLVASALLWSFLGLTARPRLLAGAFALCLAYLIGLAVLAEPVVMYGEQSRYKDKVVLSRQTAYQKIVLTRYRDDYWLYINGQLQFSSFDEQRYHEPLVHPALLLAADRSEVLILGGGDGLALREILKYPEVKKVTLVDLDPVMTELARTQPILTRINRGSMADPRVEIVNRDAAEYLRESGRLFGVIIIDLPDPDSVDLMHLYDLGFYRLVAKSLGVGGVMVTQATSPFFSRDAFLCLYKTMKASGLSVLPYHNQVPTMGEWGWLLAASSAMISESELKARTMGLDFGRVETRFINRDAMTAMAHFGKDTFYPGWEEDLRVNTRHRPVLHTYYGRGAWTVY